MRKVVCGCGWRGIETQLLRAPNPFVTGDELTACPDCRQQDELRIACARDGCWQGTTCGGTFADGVYRTTCSDHADWLRGGK